MARQVKYRAGGRGPAVSKKLIIIIVCAVLVVVAAVFCIVILPKILNNGKPTEKATVRFEGYVVDQFNEGIEGVAVFIDDLSQGKTDALGRFTLSAVELNSTVKFRSENPDVIISTPIIKVTQAYSRTEGEVPSGYVVRAEIIGKIKIINLTAMVTDMNGAPLSNVRITGEDISAVTSSDGKATLPIKAETTNLTFSVDYYATETRVIDKKSIDENTVITIKMTYTENEIKSQSALNYIFLAREGENVSVVSYIRIAYTNIVGSLYMEKVINGSFSILPEKRGKFRCFSAFATQRNANGMYYYLPHLYFSNQGATLYMSEGYMISVYVGGDVPYLFVDDGKEVKVYAAENGYIKMVMAPTESLNIRLYRSVNCWNPDSPLYESEVTLVDADGKPVTALTGNIENARIKGI